jgi:hypothetical protein
LRPRVFQLCLGLHDGQVGGDAYVLPVTLKIQSFALRLDVPLDDLPLVLIAAQHDVILGHLAQQRHEGVAARLDLGLQGTLGGFDGSSRSAKHIDFPPGIEPGLIQVEGARDGLGLGCAVTRA